MRGLLLLVCMAAGFAGVSRSSIIPVSFADAEFPSPINPGTPVQTGLPFFLGSAVEAASDVLFLRYKIPDIADVVTINSFVVNVTVFDDGDAGGEVGGVEFALPGENVPLAGFTRLNGFTAGSPETFTISSSDLAVSDADNIIANLFDGVFRVRVFRDSGDFSVAGGSVVIDGTTPEPSSWALFLAGGLCLTAGLAGAGKRFRTPAPNGRE